MIPNGSQTGEIGSYKKLFESYCKDFYPNKYYTVNAIQTIFTVDVMIFFKKKPPQNTYSNVFSGIKRFFKVNPDMEASLKQFAREHHHLYPGAHVIFRVKRLPLSQVELAAQESEYLFYAVDSYSSELFAMIYFNDTMDSLTRFIRRLFKECAYSIEVLSYDLKNFHDQQLEFFQFGRLCRKKGTRLVFDPEIDQREHEILSYVDGNLLDDWFAHHDFRGVHERMRGLMRYLNYYNWVQPHPILDNHTPGERLYSYFYPNRNIELN